MNDFQRHITDYLEYCRMQKRLDEKTLRAYRIDLTQFLIYFQQTGMSEVTPKMLEGYIAGLHQKYKPKTIPLHTVEAFLRTIYKQLSDAKTVYRKRNVLRDAAVIELLFATGIRISELCALSAENVNLYDRTVLIYGKGSKERKVQIGNDDVANILGLL